MDQDQSSDERSTIVSKAIQAVLDRHGVPERKRLVSLEAALGLAYQQVRRRMTGETPWNVDEIKRLATHFGEPVFKLLGALVDEPGQPAALQYAGQRLACSIWPGPPTPVSKLIGPLVAIPAEAPNQWTVVSVADVGEGTACEIKRLILEAAAPRRVAVIDDDDDLSNTIVQFLRHKGLDAISYRTPEHVLSALETSHFDGFILDWVLGESNTRDLLSALRSKNPTGPIIILTGQIAAGKAQEDELASTIAAFKAQLYEKPTRNLSLFNALELGFEAAARA